MDGSVADRSAVDSCFILAARRANSVLICFSSAADRALDSSRSTEAFFGRRGADGGDGEGDVDLGLAALLAPLRCADAEGPPFFVFRVSVGAVTVL